MNKEALYNIAQHATSMIKQARDPNSLAYVPGIDSGNGTPRAISPYMPQKQQQTAPQQPSTWSKIKGYAGDAARRVGDARRRFRDSRVPLPPKLIQKVWNSMAPRGTGGAVYRLSQTKFNEVEELARRHLEQIKAQRLNIQPPPQVYGGGYSRGYGADR